MDAVPLPRFRRTLVRHPAHRGPTITSVRAGLARNHEEVCVAFELAGALEHLALPSRPLEPDKLWEHTCVELFVASASGRYVEWNFSPTGQATRFEFSGYRVRTSASFDEGVRVSVIHQTDTLQLVATGPLLRGIEDAASAGLSAVARAPDDGCSYWALQHPRPEPDFHDHRGFALDAGAFTQ